MHISTCSLDENCLDVVIISHPTLAFWGYSAKGTSSTTLDMLIHFVAES